MYNERNAAVNGPVNAPTSQDARYIAFPFILLWGGIDLATNAAVNGKINPCPTPISSNPTANSIGLELIPMSIRAKLTTSKLVKSSFCILALSNSLESIIRKENVTKK